MRLALMRGFNIRRDETAVAIAPAGRRLLAFLALQGRAVERVYVAGVLWGDVPEQRASAALRTTLWRVAAQGAPVIRADAGQLELRPEVEVDFRTLVARARALLEPRAQATREDVALLRDAGDLLPDWYEDWVLVERERLRHVRMHALEAACTSLLERGRYTDAAEAGLAAVACEPLRESAHRALVRVHIAQGNRSEALRQYDLCRRLLHDRVGLAPSPAIEAAIAPLRA
jgi:DNA-binding SARP family transcriptional activator